MKLKITCSEGLFSVWWGMILKWFLRLRQWITPWYDFVLHRNAYLTVRTLYEHSNKPPREFPAIAKLIIVYICRVSPTALPRLVSVQENVFQSMCHIFHKEGSYGPCLWRIFFVRYDWMYLQYIQRTMYSAHALLCFVYWRWSPEFLKQPQKKCYSMYHVRQ